jgi:hypothetical protein
MYCPNCATPNTDDTKFCRSCGSNLTLIPQALSGHLPQPAPRELTRRERRRQRHDVDRGGPANLANGITKTFMGFGFIFVALAAFFFAPSGMSWWFWLLIPAFAMLGKGVAEIISTRYSTPTITPGVQQNAIPPAPAVGQIPPRDDAYYPPPASVTEQTTRQLDRSKDHY